MVQRTLLMQKRLWDADIWALYEDRP